mgnify:CR=1 FL=1
MKVNGILSSIILLIVVIIISGCVTPFETQNQSLNETPQSGQIISQNDVQKEREEINKNLDELIHESGLIQSKYAGSDFSYLKFTDD